MTVDVVGTYLALNDFLEPQGYEVIPEGDGMKVVRKSRKRTVFIGDTVDEVVEFVFDKFGERILVEEI